MIDIYAGNTKDIEIEVRNEDGEKVDVSNFASVQWILRKGVDIHVIKTLDTGITDDGDVFIVRLTPADTQNLAGIYTQECAVVDLNGNVSTVLVDDVHIIRTYIE